MQLTEKELSAIEDQLSEEKLLVTKLRAYSQLCSDSELKKKCECIADKHQAHYDQLFSFLG
ncbi:spore coat protein [Caproiciproducens sp. LBM24188]|nr:spore coat protein [Oscillospiraceae bacterium]HHV32542.1 spore coat protein [Clostridiales bacterium]